MTWQIVHDLIAQHRARFVHKDPTTGGWLEVSDPVARRKVANDFRLIRNNKVKHEKTQSLSTTTSTSVEPSVNASTLPTKSHTNNHTDGHARTCFLPPHAAVRAMELAQEGIEGAREDPT